MVVDGRWITCSGFAKRASSWEAFWERGLRARFLRGRLERGSAEVGMLSGICSDIFDGESDGGGGCEVDVGVCVLFTPLLVSCLSDRKAVPSNVSMTSVDKAEVV